MAKWVRWGLSIAIAASSVIVAPLAAEPVGAAVAAWPDAPVSHWDAESTACADVLFLGVRGSGEEGAYGAPIEHIRDGVRDGLGTLPGVGDARTVREVYLDYPAAAVEVIADDLQRNLDNALYGIPRDQWVWHYLDSIDAGAIRLHNFLAAQATRCPNEKWVLTGYSQGALVINMVLADFADYSRYGGVFLLANPGQKDSQPVTDLGTAPENAYGVGTLLWPDLTIPTELTGLVFSECDAYDAVCDIGTLIESVVAGIRSPSELAGDGFAVHTGYQEGILRMDAQGIVQQIMGMPVPLQSSYTIDVDPGEEFSGSVGTKPVRDDVDVVWHIKPGTPVPPGSVTDEGIIVATNGTFVGQVPEGKFVVTLEAQGEFPDHNRSVSLTIRSGDAWRPVVFGDPQLELCIRSEFQDMAWYRDHYSWLYPDFVEPAYDQPLMPEDLLDLDRVTCSNLTSLEGLQWATNVTTLELTNLQSADLTPVSPLTKLLYLQIDGGIATSLAPLSSLHDLFSLRMWDLPVSNLGPLGGLTDLAYLTIAGSEITDLTPLAGLTNMDSLMLWDNPGITSVAPLAGMSQLRRLDVRESPLLTSIAPLASITTLEDVSVFDDDLTSLDGLQNSPNIDYLQADRNRIVSLAPLTNLDKLRQVTLGGNQIVSVAPLAGKNALEYLELTGNRIVDLTPISLLPKLKTLEASFNRITDLGMFSGNSVVRTVSASGQLYERDSASVGQSFTLPVFRSQYGSVLTPTIDSGFPDYATATLSGDPATGLTLTLTGPGYLAVRWSDGAYFDGGWVIYDVTAAPLTKTPTPTISGTAHVGSTLTAVPGAWDSGVSFAYQWRRNGLVISGATSATYTVPSSFVGSTISVDVTGSKPGYQSVTKSSSGVVVAPAPLGEVRRLFGADRFATSAAISGEFDSADTVYISSGLNYPDALSAAPAAVRAGAPLLLTNSTSLPATIEAELRRLHPSRIVILGGTGTVSAAVASQIEALYAGTQVERIAGTDRFDTSRQVTRDAFNESGAQTVFIATGLNFPDALAAGPAASALGAPVILVNGGASSIDADTLALLDELGTERVFVLGGPTTVSLGIETALRSVPGLSVSRLAGADRFQTAVAINTKVFDDASVAYLATGLGYPDALSASALAGAVGAPLYTVQQTCIPRPTYDAMVAQGVQQIVLLGSTATLSGSVASRTICG
ncbi:cell wall-binding repeat-containing protein [Schumannella luteola]